MNQGLTVVIPCKNERLNIRECIESVRSIADEILVADSGSTDDTLAIVRRVGGCGIVEHSWTGYADFKEWAVSQAKHPWVFLVDADERVTTELAAEIQGLLPAPPDCLDAYKVGFKTFFMGRPLRFSNWNNLAIRLVRRDRCTFARRRVHEGMDIDRRRTGRLKSKLLHYSFWSYDEFFDKYVRYSKLTADDMWERGRRTGVLQLLVRPFLRFFQLYVLRGGFLDGLVGIQVCILMAFFYSFTKQARLWEMEYAVARPDPEQDRQAEAT